MVETWGGDAAWFQDGDPGAHEAGFLKLDSSRARGELGWKPRLHLGEALDWLVNWYQAQHRGENMYAFTVQQIRQYEELTLPRA